VYDGQSYGHYCGEYRGRVSQEVVQKLLSLFRNANYFNLFDHYAIDATDLPGYATTIAFDDKSKFVSDYEGVYVGMPESVLAIEDAIDRLAGPQVWAKGMYSDTECGAINVPVTTSDVPSKIE
jgi:hypothetical protein